jgi:hypothetical protein
MDGDKMRFSLCARTAESLDRGGCEFLDTSRRFSRISLLSPIIPKASHRNVGYAFLETKCVLSTFGSNVRR